MKQDFCTLLLEVLHIVIRFLLENIILEHRKSSNKYSILNNLLEMKL